MALATRDRATLLLRQAEEARIRRGLNRMVQLSTPAFVAQFRETANRAIAGSVVEQLRAAQPGLEAAFIKDVHPEFVKLGEKVAAVAYPMISTRRFAEAKWRTDLTKAEINTLVENILTFSQLREWSGSVLTDAFWAHYARVEQQTARVLIRAGLATNLTQSAINQLLADGGRRAGLVDIIGDTRKALFRVIEQGIEHGLSPYDTAKLIRDFVPEGRFVNAGSAYRSQLIARTETLNAQRAASLERYRANHIGMVVAYDGDTDEVCASRDGEEFTIADAQAEMSNTHPNCVLAFGPLATS